MPTNYKAYENEDGTVEFIKEGSAADVIRQDGSAVPPEVPALDQSVNDDGSKAPGNTSLSFCVLRANGQENINLDEPTAVEFAEGFHIESVEQTDWKASSAGVVINFDGFIEVHGLENFWTEGTNPQRAAPILKLTVNEIPTLAQGRNSYIRSNVGHNNSSSSITEILKVSEGDIIGMSLQRGAVAGVVNTDGESSYISIKRIG